MSIEKLNGLLEKQKLVSGWVHSLQTPNRQAAESLLQKQQDAEILNFVSATTTLELAHLLDGLEPAQATLLWLRVPEARSNEVLWELSDARRQLLAQGREPDFDSGNVSVFELVDGRLKKVAVSGRKDLEGVKPIWIDLVNASKAERAFIGGHFNVELADPLHATDLEVSARFYVEENDDIHLHSNFLVEQEGGAKSVPVAFILHGGILFSLRNQELPVFRLQRRRALTQPGYVTDCVDVLLDLYGADVECSADSLEEIYVTLGKVGRLVLNQTVSDAQAATTLANVAEEEDQNGRIRGNILDTQRALNFLMRGRLLTATQVADAKQILRNIDSLNSHTAFLFYKINFLMDATIGFINVNQNKRINQLTTFSVVFMPVNILVGAGGMSEFSMMTQGIPWQIAFTGFLVFSFLLGWLTYVLLRQYEKRQTRRIKS